MKQIAEMHHAEKRHTPGKRASVLNLSHEPRTALGYNADKLFLVVADGRQPKYSTGLTLYELASILIELGATEAINLDGGSSSTFVVDGEVVNKPSGTAGAGCFERCLYHCRCAVNATDNLGDVP